MIRTTDLYATDDLSVQLFDHPPYEPHEDPDEESSEHWGIAFVRAGHFSVGTRQSVRQLRAGSVFITHPGLRFQCQHHERCPHDVCLSIRLSPHAISGHQHAWARAPWVAQIVPTPRLTYVHRRLAGAVDAHNHFETERWALASVTALAAESTDVRARGPYAPRPADVDAVITAAREIERDPSARICVSERARAVGMTATQLTHLFRRYVGVSPHQLVIRHRLADAATRLDAGAHVSAGCFDSGFENLSHFCRSFQRTFGVRASQWTALSLRERRQKVHDMLHRIE
jgi:AraC family transcriptional regulator